MRDPKHIAGILALLLLGTPVSAAENPIETPAPAVWSQKISGLLKLNPAQQGALSAYVMTLTGSLASPGLSEHEFADMTLPDRLHYIADHVEADLTKIRAESSAMDRFYATLTPDQRLKLNQADRQPEGRLGVAADPLAVPKPDGPDYHLPSHTPPSWLLKPRGEDLARVYPSVAKRRGITGSAVMQCITDEDGYLADCVIKSESPEGMGFGNAALEMSAYMRMNPATDYGVPRPSEISIPINFALSY